MINRLLLPSALMGLSLAVTASTAPTQASNPPNASAEPQAQSIPNTGQQITPTAPRNSRFEYLNPGLADFPDYTAGQAVTSVTSPDHLTLLVLTSGYNLLNDPGPGANAGAQIAKDSTEDVFIYDISTSYPVKKQVIQVPNTYAGIAFDPSGKSFYVAGGMDDNLHVYDLNAGMWSERVSSPVALGHSSAPGLAVGPEAAGVAVTADGSKIVVANYYNDSISVLMQSGSVWSKVSELDLRPGKIDPVGGKGVAGGEYPLWVAVRNNDTAYVSSVRDREIDVVSIAGTPSVTARISVKGQPNRMVLNSAGTRLYVAEDQTDQVSIIDTAANKIISSIPVGAPAGLLTGAPGALKGNNTNSVTLFPSGRLLYVTNGNTNNVATVQLAADENSGVVIGLIPTGWYPNSVSFNESGKFMYVVNGKSPTSANPGNCHGGVLPSRPSSYCNSLNQYDLQLVKAGLQTVPIPIGTQLTALTNQVAINNHYGRTVQAADQATMAALRSKIQHVIYIIKENRTYDQVLGDLPVGNGDPALTEFGQNVTPNLHSLASNFVDLDNFYDRSEVSMDGWPWSVSARAPDTVEKQVTVNYANRGLSYDSEGTNRNINVGLPTLPARLSANPLNPQDPDLLPGTADAGGSDGPNGEPNGGYIWNAALRAGLTVRNYGFFIDLVRYQLPAAYQAFSIPLLTDPHSTNTPVAYVTNADLIPYTDQFFRGFDNIFPDYYRFTEWQRDFNANGLPQLSLVRFMHDHTGSFDIALNGVNTPELQVADNDYAVGLLVQTIAKSPTYKNNTLIFVIEDDSQDGGDHVDAHRSIAFIAGPYVKQKQVISSSYTTTDFIRTMEDVLGMGQLNLNDALATPMADVFDLNQGTWDFNAVPSPLLGGTSLPIASTLAQHHVVRPLHDARYWAGVTKGLDFRSEDKIDFARYNHILWKGIMGDKPYPERPTGLDLRLNRTALLSRYAADTTAGSN